MPFLTGLWATIKASSWALTAAKWGAIALGVLLVAFKVRQAGRDSAAREMAETIVKRTEKANEAENEVRAAADRGQPPPKRVRKFYVD